MFRQQRYVKVIGSQQLRARTPSWETDAGPGYDYLSVVTGPRVKVAFGLEDYSVFSLVNAYRAKSMLAGAPRRYKIKL